MFAGARRSTLPPAPPASVEIALSNSSTDPRTEIDRSPPLDIGAPVEIPERDIERLSAFTDMEPAVPGPVESHVNSPPSNKRTSPAWTTRFPPLPPGRVPFADEATAENAPPAFCPPTERDPPPSSRSTVPPGPELNVLDVISAPFRTRRLEE